MSIAKHILRAVVLDEHWYRQEYPDVAMAIEAGLFRDAREHFIENGYFEGRHPFPHVVDEVFYINAYADVADGIDRGMFASAFDHYARFGYLEGRLPGPG